MMMTAPITTPRMRARTVSVIGLVEEYRAHQLLDGALTAGPSSET